MRKMDICRIYMKGRAFKYFQIIELKSLQWRHQKQNSAKLFSVHIILNKIYKNYTLNHVDFPIFKENLLFQVTNRTTNSVHLGFQFFVSAEYNFETKIWSSWHFSIDNSHWKNSNTTSYQFPILGAGLRPAPYRRAAWNYIQFFQSGLKTIICISVKIIYVF